MGSTNSAMKNQRQESAPQKQLVWMHGTYCQAPFHLSSHDSFELEAAVGRNCFSHIISARVSPSQMQIKRENRKEFYSVLYSQLLGENTACPPGLLRGNTRSVTLKSKGEVWARTFIVVLWEGKRANGCGVG